MPTSDIFSPTLNTWILDRARAGEPARAELNRYMMEVYAHPLTVYYRATSYRSNWEPEDAINGFFAYCLHQPDFFTQWHQSGLRLRRWLMNGLCLYCRSRWKKEVVRNKTVPVPDEPGMEPPADDEGQNAEFARAFARAALDLARRHCAEAGLGAHWDAFVLYYVRELSCRQIAEQIGQDEPRVWVMILTAKRHYKKAVREVLVRDGVREEHIDEELGGLA